MKPNEMAGPKAVAVSLDRREFLRVGGVLAAAGALGSTACSPPQEATVPFHDMPESLVNGMGRARFFHTVIEGSPVLVRTREGRPILVAPSPDRRSGRGLSVRHHAALMDLYDPDRARGPLSVRRGRGAPVATDWTALVPDVTSRLRAAGQRAVLLSRPVTSPALASTIEALSSRTGLRHIVWSPLENDAAGAAWKLAFGDARVGRPRLDRAQLVVGLGAEFLDRPEEGFEGDFAARRTPDDGMNRFVQFEGRLTLTGANADHRIRVRDSHLAIVAASLANDLVIARRLGPLADVPEVAAALAPFSIDAVAQRVGLDAAVLRSVSGELARATGKALVVAGGTAGGTASGPALDLAALLLNLTVGAFDAGLLDRTASTEPASAGAPALAALADDMLAGTVAMLIVAGVNPVYDAPASVRFRQALGRVPFVLSLNDRLDETSLLADVLGPVSHPFECWGDARLPGGVVAIQQPVIQPLFDTRGLLDVLVEWASAAGDPAAAAASAAAATAATSPPPAPATGAPVRSASLAWHYLQAQWTARLGAERATPAFESAWNDVLRSGGWAGERRDSEDGVARMPAAPRFDASALSLFAALDGAGNPTPALELQLYPHLALGDGRSGNNGWLHELPDPITRITWGGALSIAPRRFDEMKLVNGDLVEVDVGHARLVAAAYRHAGMHDDQVALPLGLGRVACGVIGADVGANAFPLRLVAGGRLVSSGLPVKLRKVGGNQPLAFAQGSDVIDRDRRPLVPATTLTAYERDPRSGTAQQAGGPSAWPVHEYPGVRWAMAIDLTKCNGCGKCVIACQAENNIPVVGRRGILDGREMSWIRIDRYYDAPRKDGGWDAEVWDGPIAVVEEPRTLFQPMLCQHCENAPCETVCPFVATMHSADGLNQQVYNRCVGTRYCANNCPFKVRRFNFWEYGTAQDSAFFRWLEPRIARNAALNVRSPMQMKNNPEVTVRSRGVMEKCSFCVQRVRAARSDATRDGTAKEHVADGTVVPACMEACPTGAIVFGDVNAPGARVATLAADPRAMRLLEAVGVKPSISYLARVRNDKA